MMRRIRPRLSYANVVASLALFVAVGGSSYAAVQLSKNSVRSRHIANGQVKRPDLGRNAVTSVKVKDGALLRRDLRAGELLAGPPGPPGPQGPAGAAGPQGDAGVQGSPGISEYEIVSASTASNTNNSKSIVLQCPPGKKVLGGGGNMAGSLSGQAIFQDGLDGDVWEIGAYEINVHSNNWSLFGSIICANVGP